MKKQQDNADIAAVVMFLVSMVILAIWIIFEVKR